jgi:uncharacterized RDD family membrane protein YckC
MERQVQASALRDAGAADCLGAVWRAGRRFRRETELSTAQANLFEWKQEVNRRLAEHRNRKNAPAAGPHVVETEHRGSNRRGAEAAARVAQRFAHAPSYRDILMQQPQRVHTAEVHHAPVGVKSTQEPALGFQAAGHAAPAWASQAETCAPAPDVHAEEEIPNRHAPGQRDGARLFSSSEELVEAPPQEWRAADEMQAAEEESIHANLIEFPRELVATRKIRPRLAEGPYAASRNEQLSIFEVDPEAISTEAAPADALPAPDWNQAEWSNIKLEAQPAAESIAAAEAAAAATTQEIDLAPLGRRMLALFVDATLIAAAVIAAGAVSAYNAITLPGPRDLGISTLFGFVAAAVLYELLFLTLAKATPGMKYAQIALATFSNQPPSREQRQRRLAVMALSVLPVGLGLLWSLFDEERLCWHDRLSQTYLKCS